MFWGTQRKFIILNLVVQGPNYLVLWGIQYWDHFELLDRKTFDNKMRPLKLLYILQKKAVRTYQGDLAEVLGPFLGEIRQI
jgi:hypothetical protein